MGNRNSVRYIAHTCIGWPPEAEGVTELKKNPVSAYFILSRNFTLCPKRDRLLPMLVPSQKTKRLIARTAGRNHRKLA